MNIRYYLELSFSVWPRTFGFITQNGTRGQNLGHLQSVIKIFLIMQKVFIFSQLAQFQGLKIALVRSYLRVPQAAEQVQILIFLVKLKCFPCMPIFLRFRASAYFKIFLGLNLWLVSRWWLQTFESMLQGGARGQNLGDLKIFFNHRHYLGLTTPLWGRP